MYRIKREKPVSTAGYDEKSYRIAINDDRIKELITMGMLQCEFGTVRENDSIVKFASIDPANVCAKILEIHDNYILVEPCGPFGETLRRVINNNTKDVVAVMRYIAKTRLLIQKVVTFDIIVK